MKKALEAFGLWLLIKRETLGLKRSHLAKALGYKNMRKGCRRILHWERGQKDIPTEHHKTIQTILSVTDESWHHEREKIQKARSKIQFYNRSEVHIKNGLEQHLADFCDLLLENLQIISETPNWRHIQLHGLKFGMMYIGGASEVHLGGLLQAWSNGRLRSQTEEGPIWIFSGGCSPLSGWNTLHGFNYRTRKRGHFRNLFSPASNEIGPMVNWARKTSMGHSQWSLAQLLAQLGVPLEPAEIMRHGQYFASYDFKAAVLNIDETHVRFPLQKHHAHQYHRTHITTEADWGSLRSTGGIVLGDVLTGQPGSYRGEKSTIEHHTGLWTLKPGMLCRPDGCPVLSWTADIPPMVQAWLVNNTAEELM